VPWRITRIKSWTRRLRTTASGQARKKQITRSQRRAPSGASAWPVDPPASVGGPILSCAARDSVGSSLAYLPTAAEVTSMSPSVTPNRTGVRIHRWCRIHARCRIDRIFINHHWRRRYNDRPPNHDGLGNDGSLLLDNDRRRTPVLVRMPLIAWCFPIRSYRQIGGHCRRGKS
jgi:hypothetical protein